MKKSPKLSPDVILKKYWNDNARFADLFNAYFFHGNEIITAEELTELDTDMSDTLNHKDFVETSKAARDIIKVAKKSSKSDINFVILGIENQEYIDYSMPVRVMNYDSISYKKQLQQIALSNKNNPTLNQNEFLSKFKKTDKLVPVVTIVIYYGDKPWDGAKSLFEMFNFSDEAIIKLANNYRLNLLEVKNNDFKFHNKYNIDFFNLMKIILDNSLPKKDAYDKAIKYAEENKTDNSVILTVAGATNAKINYAKMNGGNAMCTLFDEIAAEASIKTYIQTCREFNVTEEELIQKLITKFNLTKEEAKDYIISYLEN